MHRPRVLFSQSVIPFISRAGRRIPSISTTRAQAWRRFAQVIHMLMHTTPVSGPAAGLAASSGSERWGLRDMPGTQRRGPGSEEIAQEAGHRWSPPLYRTGGRCIYPPACPSRHLGQYGLAAAGAHECAGRSLSCLCYRSHKLEHDAPAPSTTGSASEGPRPFSAVAPRVIAAGIPGGCRHAEPVQSHSCRA